MFQGLNSNPHRQVMPRNSTILGAGSTEAKEPTAVLTPERERACAFWPGVLLPHGGVHEPLFSEPVSHPAVHKPDAHSISVTRSLKWILGVPDYPDTAQSSAFLKGRGQGRGQGWGKGQLPALTKADPPSRGPGMSQARLHNLPLEPASRLVYKHVLPDSRM